jgi:hypothetical protein
MSRAVDATTVSSQDLGLMMAGDLERAEAIAEGGRA